MRTVTLIVVLVALAGSATAKACVRGRVRQTEHARRAGIWWSDGHLRFKTNGLRRR